MKNDLLQAFRSLRSSPGFTFVALLTISLGIGATTAVFTVVDRVLLRPSPLARADRLVMVWETDENSGTVREPASVPDYLDFRAQSSSFTALGAFASDDVNLTPASGEPVRIPALSVDRAFLPLIGIAPLLGRSFTSEEDTPGGPRAVMLGEELWERAYRRDPAVVGSTIRIDEEEHVVVGVVPAAADYGVLQVLSAADYGRGFAERGQSVDVDLWMPLRADPEATPRHTHPILLVGRLAEGRAFTAAQREMTALAARLEQAYPENEGRGVHVEPLSDVVVGPVRPALLILMGAVAVVLLIACANVANLLLVRGVARRREVAVRRALGAGRLELTRQFLIENLVLALLAAGLGVVVAQLLLGLLVDLAPAGLSRVSEVRIDGRVLAVALGTTVAIGLAFGMLPALQAWRLDVQAALKEPAGRGSSAGVEAGRLRHALVVAETALAVMLLIGAGLLVKSFWRVLQVDPGFRTEQVVKAEFQFPASRYPQDFSKWPDWPEILRFNRDLLESAARLPGVTSVALAGAHPLNAGFTNSFEIVGREAESEDAPEIPNRLVSPGYFATVGVPVRSGRAFGESDDGSAPRVVLINATAAARFFAGREPLGAQIRLWGLEWTIVGVVGDERIHGLTAPAPPAVYLSLLQAPISGGETLLVGTRGDASALAGGVARAIREVDPGMAVFGVETLRQTLEHSVGQRRFTMLMLAAFAALALLLAIVGVHGVLSYAVAQRTREIGIRLALGASPGAVVASVVGRGMALAMAGVALGLAGALALTRLLRALLYGVTATDPATFAGVVAVLAGVTFAASYIPGRRAAATDPMTALRQE